MSHPGFGPIRLPAEAFEELEPIRRESDGRLLRRCRIKALGPNGPILTEDPMDQTFRIEDVKREPLPMPQASIFYQDFGFDEAFKKDKP